MLALAFDTTYAVTINITDVDEPPEITLASAAGVDVTVDESAVSVDENHTADLVDVTAMDPEGIHADYTLALGGTHSGSFTLNTGVLSFTNPPDHEARDVYRLRLTASNADESSTLDVTVTVGDVNEPPIITGDPEVTVNEGHTGTLRTYQKSDPDRPVQATNWGPVGSSEVLSGAHSDSFVFDQTTRRLTFASPPDFEGGGSQYQVILTANDGTLDGSLDITVNVANLEETGTLALSGGVLQGANGVLLQATLTDPDGVATETWVWQRRTGTSGAWTDIASTNASSYTPTAADVGSYLRASVTYTDGAGTEETTLTVATESPTLNDDSGNQPPTPPDPLPQVDAIPENAGGRNVARVVFTDPEGERLTYSLDGSSEFAINTGTGQITVQSGGLDYEDTRSHDVTVKAADLLGASATATLTVDVDGRERAAHSRRPRGEGHGGRDGRHRRGREGIRPGCRRHPDRGGRREQPTRRQDDGERRDQQHHLYASRELPRRGQLHLSSERRQNPAFEHCDGHHHRRLRERRPGVRRVHAHALRVRKGRGGRRRGPPGGGHGHRQHHAHVQPLRRRRVVRDRPRQRPDHGPRWGHLRPAGDLRCHGRGRRRQRRGQCQGDHRRDHHGRRRSGRPVALQRRWRAALVAVAAVVAEEAAAGPAPA